MGTAFAALTIGVALSACSPGASGPGVVQATTATPPASSATSMGATGSAATGSPATTKGGSGAPVGIGSTLSAFTAAHGADTGDLCSAASPCFGPAVVNGESGHTFEFTDVLVRGGLVLGYDQSFRTGTPLSKATAQVLSDLPADAHAGPVTVDTNGGSCGLFDVTSATLGAALGSHPGVGDQLGIVGVKLSYTDNRDSVVFDPHNVQDAILTLIPVNPADKC